MPTSAVWLLGRAAVRRPAARPSVLRAASAGLCGAGGGRWPAAALPRPLAALPRPPSRSYADKPTAAKTGGLKTGMFADVLDKAAKPAADADKQGRGRDAHPANKKNKKDDPSNTGGRFREPASPDPPKTAQEVLEKVPDKKPCAQPQAIPSAALGVPKTPPGLTDRSPTESSGFWINKGGFCILNDVFCFKNDENSCCPAACSSYPLLRT